TSPSQGLFVLNSPFMIEQAESLARDLLAGPTADDSARIDRAFLTLLGRRPRAAELARVMEYLAPTASVVGRDATARIEAERLSTWTSFAHAMMALPEFRFVF